MNIPKIALAVGGIDDDLIAGAMEYRRTKKRNTWVRWGVVAACLCVLAMTAVPFLRAPMASPFVLTAYAVSPEDGELVPGVLEKGKRIPISRIETAGGLVGFVTSYQKQGDASAPSISFVGSAPVYREAEVELTGEQQSDIEVFFSRADDPTRVYYFFLPGEGSAPYTLPLTLYDEENQMEYRYEIEIVGADGCYYAEIMEETAVKKPNP